MGPEGIKRGQKAVLGPIDLPFENHCRVPIPCPSGLSPCIMMEFNFDMRI